VVQKSKKQLPDLPIKVEAILNAMPEFAYVFNKQDELVLWNKNLELILGYSADAAPVVRDRLSVCHHWLALHGHDPGN
jgi:PAS domain-containing protein